jgi:hypothetical protein
VFISIVGTPAHISKLHTNNGIEKIKAGLEEVFAFLSE